MSSTIKVVKFGGTSLGDSNAILRSAQIALDQNANVIVVSAVSGITNHLAEIKSILKQGLDHDIDGIIEMVRQKHLSVLSQLDSGQNTDFVNEMIENIRGLCDSPRNDLNETCDEVLACGEMLSSHLMNVALGKLGADSEVFDARGIIKTDDNHGLANPDIGKIKTSGEKLLRPKLKNKVIVTQGFIGQSEEGNTTTLGRGGSDYSAALIAEAIGADELQIWTDVTGIATADPKIVKTANKVPEITFQEAAELATSGAKILHSRTITPARRSNIPIYVGNSFMPESEGTLITESVSKAPIIRAMTLKRNQSIIRITATEMAEQFGYLSRVLDVFTRHRIVLDQITTSEITVAFGVEDTVLSHSQLMEDLQELGDIKIEKNVNAISLIGNNINSTPGLIKDIFDALESEGDKISVRMICQGASKHNICFFVLESEGEKAVKKLHKELIESREW